MTQHERDARIQGSLRSEGGAGVVRLEVRLATDVADVWSALTDPQRLAGWLGEVDGDLREGGELTGHWLASGWEGRVRIEACEPSRRLLVSTESADGGGAMEITLAAGNGHTTLAFEDRGVPLDDLAAYGAGNQIHVEDLAAHLDGHDRCDARARFQELLPGWKDRAAGVPQRLG